MIHFICFSYNRPLQLHAYLSSLYFHVTGEARISVILRCDAEYLAAYQHIQQEFRDVSFVYETEFSSQLLQLVDIPDEYICFGCDDVIFVAPLSTTEAMMGLTDPEIIGISLRLGTHITRNMFWSDLPQPNTLLFSRPFINWDVRTGIGDWGYPWEVLGTVYHANFVRTVAHAIQAGSPSQLEERGSQQWSMFTDATQFLAWPEARIVVPTINIVQSEFPNGICGSKPLDPDFLLLCWNYNLRCDINRYAGITPASWRIGEYYLTRT